MYYLGAKEPFWFCQSTMYWSKEKDKGKRCNHTKAYLLNWVTYYILSIILSLYTFLSVNVSIILFIKPLGGMSNNLIDSKRGYITIPIKLLSKSEEGMWLKMLKFSWLELLNSLGSVSVGDYMATHGKVSVALNNCFFPLCPLSSHILSLPSLSHW